jgi:hypothetical protein
MKKLILILIPFLLLSCNDKENMVISKEEYQKLKGEPKKPDYPIQINIPKKDPWDVTNRIDHIEVIVIDSCEYIVGDDDGGYNGGIYLTHKGNCKFCKKRMYDMIHHYNEDN